MSGSVVSRPAANSSRGEICLVGCRDPYYRCCARALDLAARGGQKLESIPDAIMDEVLAKLAPIFE